MSHLYDLRSSFLKLHLSLSVYAGHLIDSSSRSIKIFVEIDGLIINEISFVSQNRELLYLLYRQDTQRDLSRPSFACS